MFGLFRKRKSAQAEAISDIELTLLKTYERIQDAAADQSSLPRRMNVVAALAAMMGALRDTYPDLPIEDENIAIALVEANAALRESDADGLASAIIDLVERCPNQRNAKIDTMMWMIAPKMMKR